MKLEFTGNHYHGGSYRFIEPGVYDVDEAKAEQLLADFPDQFAAAEGAQKAASEAQPTKSLAKMNRAELEAVAAEIGLDMTAEMDTNAKLKAAIEAHREG